MFSVNHLSPFENYPSPFNKNIDKTIRRVIMEEENYRESLGELLRLRGSSTSTRPDADNAAVGTLRIYLYELYMNMREQRPCVFVLFCLQSKLFIKKSLLAGKNRFSEGERPRETPEADVPAHPV